MTNISNTRAVIIFRTPATATAILLACCAAVKPLEGSLLHSFCDFLHTHTRVGLNRSIRVNCAESARGKSRPWLRTQLTGPTAECDAEGCATLTEQQAASGRRPADLHVVNLHVLGNVLHRDFLRNLKQTNKKSRKLTSDVFLSFMKNKNIPSVMVRVRSPSSQSRLCLGSHHRWPCLRTTGKQSSPW